MQDAGAAPDTNFGIHLATSGCENDALFDDSYGLLRAIYKASLAPGTDIRVDASLALFLSTFFWGETVSLGIDNGSPGAGVKTGAAFLTEVWIYVKTNLDFAVNCIFRASLGAGTTSGTIFANLVYHNKKESIRKKLEHNCFVRSYKKTR